MQIPVVNYLAGMEISTIVIANIQMLHASFDDSSCDVTKCALIVAIHRERWCVFAIYITVGQEQPFRFTGALGGGDGFSFRSWHGDEILLPWLPWDSSVAEKQDMTTLGSGVGTIIGPIGVCVVSESIISVSAAAAAKIQLKVGCRL